MLSLPLTNRTPTDGWMRIMPKTSDQQGFALAKTAFGYVFRIDRINPTFQRTTITPLLPVLPILIKLANDTYSFLTCILT